ncbi:hypothetical protein Tcan_00872, partial [Toxocara canis]
NELRAFILEEEQLRTLDRLITQNSIVTVKSRIYLFMKGSQEHFSNCQERVFYMNGFSITVTAAPLCLLAQRLMTSTGRLKARIAANGTARMMGVQCDFSLRLLTEIAAFDSTDMGALLYRYGSYTTLKMF